MLSSRVNLATQQEILNLLAKQSKLVPLAKIPAVLLVVALAWIYAPIALTLGWLCAITAVLLVRWYLLGNIHQRFALNPEQGLRLGVWLSLINGLVMGCSLIFFPYLPEIERAMHTLILLGVCTGAIATTAGYLPLLLTYAVPIVTPLALMWATAGAEHANWAGPGLAVLIAMFLGLMISLARDTSHLYFNSFRIRSEQSGLNQQLQTALDQAEIASLAKTRFLASASHDLRQPIHTLSLFAAALSRRNLDQKSQQIADHMDTAIQALASQLDALLDVSKLDAGVVPVNPKNIDVGEVLKRLYAEHQQVAEQKGLHLSISERAHITINSDPHLLDRILRNLISNAIKYTDTGSVKLALTRRHNQPIISISDTGRGIPPAEQKRIFEEFYQLNNPERDRSKGLGLGLSIVRRMTNLLNIELSLSSVPGQGTSISLTFPAQSEEITAIQSLPDATLNWQKLSVLIVDSQPHVRAAMTALLEELGCTVWGADSIAKALRTAQSHTPDIVLSDIRLSGTDNGPKLIEALRNSYPMLPAVLVGSDPEPAYLEQIEQAQLRLLHKPVTLSALGNAIAAELKAP